MHVDVKTVFAYKCNLVSPFWMVHWHRQDFGHTSFCDVFDVMGYVVWLGISRHLFFMELLCIYFVLVHCCTQGFCVQRLAMSVAVNECHGHCLTTSWGHECSSEWCVMVTTSVLLEATSVAVSECHAHYLSALWGHTKTFIKCWIVEVFIIS